MKAVTWTMYEKYVIEVTYYKLSMHAAQ